MSVILQCGLAISRANTNTSTAKHMYTFSRAERFPPLKTIGHSLNMYDLPSTKDKRRTTLGYGERSDFTKTDKNYKAELYDKGSDFNPQRPHGPRYTFSCGREKYGKVYLDTAKLFDKDVPGPGKYNYLKPFGYGAPCYSIKGRYDSENKKKKDDKNGEEGEKTEQKDDKEKLKTYFYNNPLKINPHGRYPLSTVRNVNSLRFGNDKTKRSAFVINKNPGPTEYTIRRMFDNQNKSEGITILQRYKVVDSRSNYPGPGSYRLPSDFGIYVSKDAKDIKYPEENVYEDPTVKRRKELYEKDPKPWQHNMKVKKEEETPGEQPEEENNDNDNNNENNEENREEENKGEENKDEENKEEENKDEEEKKDEEKKKEEYVMLNDILKEEPEYDDDEEEGNTPGDEKAEGDTPGDEKVEGDTPGDEKVEGNTPGDEKAEGNTPGDEKAVGDTPGGEKAEGNTPGGEKAEGNTPGGEKA